MRLLLICLLLVSNQAFAVFGNGGCLYFGKPDNSPPPQPPPFKEAIIATIEAVIGANPLFNLGDLERHNEHVKDSHEAISDMISTLSDTEWTSYYAAQIIKNRQYLFARNQDDEDCNKYFEKHVKDAEAAKKSEKIASVATGAASLAGNPLITLAIGGYAAYATYLKQKKSEANLQKYTACVDRKKEEVKRINAEYAASRIREYEAAMRAEKEKQDLEKKNEKQDIESIEIED